MKDVRGNGYYCIFGDQTSELSLQPLRKIDVNIKPTVCTTINTDSFTYKDHSQKNTRLHSKKTQCILHCLHSLKLHELIAGKDKEKIGIYVNCPHEYLSADFPDFSKNSLEDGFFQQFKKSIQPTHSIKNVAGIIPGHIAVFYEIYGPTHTETSISGNGLFEKARLDIDTGLIDFAIVAAVNTYDDALTQAMHLRAAGEQKLIEAAGVVLLDKNNLNLPDITLDKNFYYGHFNQLIKL